MTISIPPLLPENVPAGPSPAGAEPDPSVLTAGFDLMMSAEAGIRAGAAAPDVAAPGVAAGEQAAVLAASLLWSPPPMHVETPPPAPDLNLETGDETGTMTPAPLLPEATTARPALRLREDTPAMPSPVMAGATNFQATPVPARESAPNPVAQPAEPTHAKRVQALPVETTFQASPLRTKENAAQSSPVLSEETAAQAVPVLSMPFAAQPVPVSSKAAAQPLPLPTGETAGPIAVSVAEFRTTLMPAEKPPVMVTSADVPVMPPQDKMPAANPAKTPDAPLAPSNNLAETVRTARAALGAAPVPTVAVTVDRSDLRRPFRSPASREEKIAAAFNPVTRDLPQTGQPLPKTFVSSSRQAVRGGDEFVGTSVAKTASEMSSPAATQLSNVEAFVASPVLPASSAPGSQPLQIDLSSTEPAEQVRDAVSTVIAVIDAQEKPESAAPRSVNLDFNFGGERLAVRVEYRDGMVHAHFRTESLELRSALAQEWSHVAAAPENVLRLVEPVFVSSSRSESPASFNADGGAARQQSQSQGESPGSAFSSRPVPAGFRSTPAADAPEAPRLRHLSTALHLQAVA